jgi:hypothetical protein
MPRLAALLLQNLKPCSGEPEKSLHLGQQQQKRDMSSFRSKENIWSDYIRIHKILASIFSCRRMPGNFRF